MKIIRSTRLIRVKMPSHRLINQTSGKVEYYTPQNIVEAARSTMGGIDLDPASSSLANEKVKATKYFDPADLSLNRPWLGRVWMNHPFLREENKLWVNKLENEYVQGNTKEACCITFAATSEKWFRPLLLRPQCFLTPRTNYVLPDGTLKRGVTKGSVVTYFGKNLDRFIKYFSPLGVVKVPCVFLPIGRNPNAAKSKLHLTSKVAFKLPPVPYASPKVMSALSASSLKTRLRTENPSPSPSSFGKKSVSKPSASAKSR